MSNDDLNISDIEFGDTLQNSAIVSNKNSPNKISENNTITLEQIAQLLVYELTKNKISIIEEMKNMIKYEINTAIKDIQLKVTHITQEQKALRNSIDNINTKIQKLTSENEKLKKDLQEFQQTADKNINNINRTTIPQQHYTIPDYSKSIVLYGLNEYNGENDVTLESRIIHAFMDIAEINLTGYIEELDRIGRRGTRRPIRIELISKRMSTYIINNARCFKNSGLYVSKYLDKEALDERKKQRETYYNKCKQTLNSSQNQTLRNSQNISNAGRFPERNHTNINHYISSVRDAIPGTSVPHSFRF